ncbi:MAG: hypothetical protein QOJ16_2429 [Acidobacteriota bacterium]|jgi:predicted ATPase|nr:hypothetical protein [Acidobacteriota bacterium]
MIEKLSLRNFRVLRNVDVDLRPFSLLVGPNASGKSSLLKALEILTRYIAGQGSAFSGELAANELLSRTPKGDLRLSCKGHYSGEELSFSLVVPGYMPLEGRWRGKQLTQNVLDDLAQIIRPAALLNLDVKKLAAPYVPQAVTLALPNDGEGLSSILAGLYLQHPKRFVDLIEQLREIVPGVLNVRFKRTPLKNGIADELLFDMQGAEDIPAFAISDGTLLTLGLLTILAAPEPPQLVLIDELERGLHPKALADLVQQLRRLQEQNPELQIVATSHSPYLLDHFKAEEILLTSLDAEGYAAVKPLTDHPEYERWKDLMAPGEFWSTVGESWITEGDSKKASATGR